MNYEFKKLGEVEALTEIPENANALVEVGGAIKRVPAGALAGVGGRFTFNGTITSEPKEQNGSTMTFDVTFDKEYSEVEKAWNDGQSVFCVIDMGLLSDGEEHAGYFAYLPVITYNINTNEIVCALNFNGSNLVAWIYPDTAQNQFQMTLPSA